MTGRKTNLFEALKKACDPADYDLTTAEGRADWDDDLRDFINTRTATPDATDKALRDHLGDLTKKWRRDALLAVDRTMFKSVEYEIFKMETTKDG